MNTSTHIEHRGCECADCHSAAMARHDALAIIHQAVREGGCQILLGAIGWHVEERYPLEYRMQLQAKHGSTFKVHHIAA